MQFGPINKLRYLAFQWAAFLSEARIAELRLSIDEVNELLCALRNEADVNRGVALAADPGFCDALEKDPNAPREMTDEEAVAYVKSFDK